MPEIRDGKNKEKPWGLYLAMAFAFLLLVFVVGYVLQPILDNPKDREELGIDRIREMMAREHYSGDDKPIMDPVIQGAPSSE